MHHIFNYQIQVFQFFNFFNFSFLLQVETETPIKNGKRHRLALKRITVKTNLNLQNGREKPNPTWKTLQNSKQTLLQRPPPPPRQDSTSNS